MSGINIHCLALNYKGVGNSKNEPLYFVKSPISLCYENAEILYPRGSKKLWTEVELGVVIGRTCFNVDENAAEEFIEGFIVAADITCENIHGRDHHLGFSKSRRNFCPVSSRIIRLPIYELKHSKLFTFVNGQLTQSGSIDEMHYGIAKSIAYISSLVEIQKGDVILTGTPRGVENNILNIGDVVKHHIERVGDLSYKII